MKHGKIEHEKPAEADDLVRIVSHDLLAVLGDVQSTQLTADKTATVMRRDGYKISGFTLACPTSSTHAAHTRRKQSVKTNRELVAVV